VPSGICSDPEFVSLISFLGFKALTHQKLLIHHKEAVSFVAPNETFQIDEFKSWPEQ
jgi:hypothetical protein